MSCSTASAVFRSLMSAARTSCSKPTGSPATAVTATTCRTGSPRRARRVPISWRTRDGIATTSPASGSPCSWISRMVSTMTRGFPALACHTRAARAAACASSESPGARTVTSSRVSALDNASSVSRLSAHSRSISVSTSPSAGASSMSSSRRVATTSMARRSRRRARKAGSRRLISSAQWMSSSASSIGCRSARRSRRSPSASKSRACASGVTAGAPAGSPSSVLRDEEILGGLSPGHRAELARLFPERLVAARLKLGACLPPVSPTDTGGPRSAGLSEAGLHILTSTSFRIMMSPCGPPSRWILTSPSASARSFEGPERG
jgi:hypothetical protein